MSKAEHSGGDVNYYVVYIAEPKRPEFPAYHAECEDIIEALGMTFAEGCAFKALWRSCAERTLGKVKQGGDAVYDAEKIAYYGKRILAKRIAIRKSLETVVEQPVIEALLVPIAVVPEPVKVKVIPAVDPLAHQAAHDLLHGKPVAIDYTKVDQELRQAAIDVGGKK